MFFNIHLDKKATGFIRREKTVNGATIVVDNVEYLLPKFS